MKKFVSIVLFIIILLNNILILNVSAEIVLYTDGDESTPPAIDTLPTFDLNSYIDSKYRVYQKNGNFDFSIAKADFGDSDGVSTGLNVYNSQSILFGDSTPGYKEYNFEENVCAKYSRALTTDDGQEYDVYIYINKVWFTANANNWTVALGFYGSKTDDKYIGVGESNIGIVDANINYTTTYKVYKAGTDELAHIPGIFQMCDIDAREEYTLGNLSSNINGDIKSKIYKCSEIYKMQVDLTGDVLKVKDLNGGNKNKQETSSIFILFDDISSYSFTESHYGDGGMDMYFVSEVTRSDIFRQNKQIIKKVEQQKIDNNNYKELTSEVVYEQIEPDAGQSRTITYSINDDITGDKEGYEFGSIVIDGTEVTKEMIEANSGTYNLSSDIEVTTYRTIFNNIDNSHIVEVKYRLIDYDIDYHLGEGETTNSPTTYNKSEEDQVLSDATKAGYIFKGWYDKQDPEPEDVAITKIPAGTIGNIDLFPKWELVNYQIVYHLDGYEPEAINDPSNPTNVDVENEIGLNSASRDGYICTGWKGSPDGSDENPITRLTKEKIIELADENNVIHLYPVWQPDPTTKYKVVYKMENLDGGWDENIVEGTGAPGVDKIRVQDYLLSEDESKGFELIEPLDGEADISPYGDTEFEIRYVRKIVKINYDPNGGTDIEIEGEAEKNTESVKYGDRIVRPDDEYKESKINKRTPSRRGYEFDVWQTEDGSTFSLTDTPIPDVEEINLIAKWTESDSTYTVIKYKEELDGTYTKQEPEVINAITGDEVFYYKNEKGFTIDEENEKTVLSGIVDPEGELVLTVYYKRDNYEVIIDKNDGSDDHIITQTKKFEETADKIENPTREGYIFDGWETEDGKPFSFEDPIEGNVRIIAKWKLKNGNSPKTGDQIIYSVIAFIASSIGLIIINTKNKSE